MCNNIFHFNKHVYGTVSIFEVIHFHTVWYSQKGKNSINGQVSTLIKGSKMIGIICSPFHTKLTRFGILARYVRYNVLYIVRVTHALLQIPNVSHNYRIRPTIVAVTHVLQTCPRSLFK